MCLAIYKPAKVQVSKKHLKNGFFNNEDGAGFAIAENGRIEIYKGFFTFGDFWKAYKGHSHKAALIHFRWATHGLLDQANCHPFSICDGNYAVVHNGVLDIDTKSAPDASDTFHFVTRVLQPMLESTGMEAPAFRYLVETSIGSHNKIAMLRADGHHVIYNESAGQWLNGAWFSNNGYKRKAAPSWVTSAAAAVKGDVEYWTGKRAYRSAKAEAEAFPDYEGRAHAAEDRDWTYEEMENLGRDDEAWERECCSDSQRLDNYLMRKQKGQSK